jgi:hypothetical protein
VTSSSEQVALISIPQIWIASAPDNLIIVRAVVFLGPLIIGGSWSLQYPVLFFQSIQLFNLYFFRFPFNRNLLKVFWHPIDGMPFLE